ncbi:MAG: hypothetical protein IIB22_11655, partial [Chloroflexi bacterium]|nr:hypothetical protein [Chloroflexota bacterium]
MTDWQSGHDISAMVVLVGLYVSWIVFLALFKPSMVPAMPAEELAAFHGRAMCMRVLKAFLRDNAAASTDTLTGSVEVIPVGVLTKITMTFTTLAGSTLLRQGFELTNGVNGDTLYIDA